MKGRLSGVVLLLLGSVLDVRGQDLRMGPIPDSLRQNASVIERLGLTEIDITSPRKATIRRRVIYTILNPAGDGFGTVRTYYDRFHDLVSATAALYDSNGKLLRKIRKNDMEDWSEAGSGILMTDSRVKLYHFSSRSYPYTVSYEDEVEQSGLFVLPNWQPQPAPGMAVESSKLVVKGPAGLPIRYKPYGYAMNSVEMLNGNKRIYSCELRDRRAVPQEAYAPPWAAEEPGVLLAAGRFEQDGYSGRLDSWADLGRFVDDLYRGRDQLPEEAKRQVHALVDGLEDDKKKIDTLYAFLQRDTHYVGIELGIGGWQPFDAGYVYSRKYGDCKALGNYMVALLKEAGIRAYNVLIRAGDNAVPMDTGFVCSQFNHEIVVAIAGHDSVWLECTSPYLPAGYLGSWTDDRDGLLLDGEGGHLVHTPAYGVTDNQIRRVVHGRVDSAGDLAGEIQIVRSGLEQDGLAAELNHLSRKELLDQEQQSLGLQNCSIRDLQIEMRRTAVPSIKESIRMTAALGTATGKRLLIYPAVFFKQIPEVGDEGAERRSKVALKTSNQETDSVFLVVPRGYVPEGDLPGARYAAEFGSYRVSGKMNGDTLQLACQYRQQKGIYPAALWDQLVTFIEFLHRDAGGELVLIKAGEKQ